MCSPGVILPVPGEHPRPCQPSPASSSRPCPRALSTVTAATVTATTTTAATILLSLPSSSPPSVFPASASSLSPQLLVTEPLLWDGHDPEHLISVSSFSPADDLVRWMLGGLLSPSQRGAASTRWSQGLRPRLQTHSLCPDAGALLSPRRGWPWGPHFLLRGRHQPQVPPQLCARPPPRSSLRNPSRICAPSLHRCTRAGATWTSL